MSDKPSARDNLDAILQGYIGTVRDYERALGIGLNEPVPVTGIASERFQDLRYRIILLNWLLREGEFDTTEIYRQNATCDQPFFYPEILATACGVVEEIVDASRASNDRTDSVA